MTLELRPYQSDLIANARAALKQHRRVLLVSPTGSGKTALTVYMMRAAAQQGLSSIFAVHQNELLQQTASALWRQSLEHGVIAAGRAMSRLPAQVASVQTLVRRMDKYSEPRLFIIDEAHRAMASTYLRILEQWPNCKVIGLTATPERTDGKGLDNIFDIIVMGPQPSDLIGQGYLCEYELMAPPSTLDMSGVAVKMGDFDKEETEHRVDTKTITGNAVEHYIEFANGKRCVVMCVSLKHGAHVVDEYRAAGIAAELIRGDLGDDERAAILERFAAGTTRVLCNVNLMVEGVDIPAIEVIQWLRPTQSLIVWMQGNGRGMRPAPGKDKLLILDHVGNWNRPGFGMPDDPREWSLSGRKERRKRETPVDDVTVRQCPSCYMVYRAHLSECPRCNSAAVKTQREIEIVEGRLALIQQDAARKTQRREQGAARAMRDLIMQGQRKGMAHPDKWAVHIICAREDRKPTREDWELGRDTLRDIRAPKAVVEFVL